MTESVSRRRFLTDLTFIGGALALAAGLGSTPPPPPPPAVPEADAHRPQYQSCVGGMIERP